MKAAKSIPQFPSSRSRPRASRRGGAVAFVLVGLALVAAGFFIWREYDRRQKARKAREATILAYNEEQRRLRELQDVPKTAVAVETQKVEVVEVKRPPKPKQKQKSGAEVWKEDLATWTAAVTAIEAASATAEKPLAGLGGVIFGSVLEAAPVRWGQIQRRLDTPASVGTNGVTFAVYGPKFKKSFLSFGQQPVVWVTPKTHKVYRIELERPIRAKPSSVHDSDTTNAVAQLRARFGCEPVALVPMRPERPGCEYVFPLKDALLKVGEYGGLLRLTAESETVRREALAESAAVREERRADVVEGKLLDSTRYPNRPIDKKKYKVRFKDETPRAFCGVVFASRPPENAALVNPQQGAKGFFLDYEKAKCRPFNGFSRGRAEIDAQREGVYAVTLFSPGGEGGLDDTDYFEGVKKALAEHYKVTPTEEKGSNAFARVTYIVGDLTITLGPDDRGGFSLRAENRVLADLARQVQSPPRKKVRVRK